MSDDKDYEYCQYDVDEKELYDIYLNEEVEDYLQVLDNIYSDNLFD
jgi:hypothetical protein